jgi:hypothetical protein
MASRTILSPTGLKSLTRFLQAELPILVQSPILFIASEPATSQSSLTSVADACQHTHFTLAQQLGLRTVSSTVSSAFPTMEDLEKRLELARRTGSKSVVCVGSGAAIDLGKAMVHSNKEIEHLILVPATHAAVLASSCSHSLFLDKVEEAIVILPTSSITMPPTTTTTIAPLESKLVSSVDSSHMVYASMAIVLDSFYREGDNSVVAVNHLLTKALTALDDEISHDLAMELLFEAGTLLSYGVGKEDRSTPLALAASLIPRIFPHVPVLTFLASLLPGICQVVVEGSNFPSSNNTVQLVVERILQDSTKIPQMTVAEEFAGFSVPDMSLSHIQSNQALWNCLDVPDDVLMQIISQSVKR